mmetsp:Transcript_6928/g.22992  ORF Transcript_6928/g.22992 Transcript_6928/m.22992 type:complete len:318 (+) Transcript_6928:3562-4515(+)
MPLPSSRAMYSRPSTSSRISLPPWLMRLRRASYASSVMLAGSPATVWFKPSPESFDVLRSSLLKHIPVKETLSSFALSVIVYLPVSCATNVTVYVPSPLSVTFPSELVDPLETEAEIIAPPCVRRDRALSLLVIVTSALSPRMHFLRPGPARSQEGRCRRCAMRAASVRIAGDEMLLMSAFCWSPGRPAITSAPSSGGSLSISAAPDSGGMLASIFARCAGVRCSKMAAASLPPAVRARSAKPSSPSDAIAAAAFSGGRLITAATIPSASPAASSISASCSGVLSARYLAAASGGMAPIKAPASSMLTSASRASTAA